MQVNMIKTSLKKLFFPDILRTQAFSGAAINDMKFCLCSTETWTWTGPSFQQISNKLCSVWYLKYVIVWAKSIIEIILVLLYFPRILFSMTPSRPWALRVLLHQGEQWVGSHKESAGLAGHQPTISNKESRAGLVVVMVTAVRCRWGIARWVCRAES